MGSRPGRRFDPVPAILLVARAELRRHWLSLLLIGLIAGLTGGAVASASALARRTETADERLAVATNADDVRSIIFGGERAATAAIGEETLALPGVRRGRIALGGVARVTGETITYLAVMTGPEHWGRDILSPVLAEGRLPDPDRADEVVVNELVFDGPDAPFAMGDEVELRFLTGLEFTQFDASVPLEGRAGTLIVRVVGAVRFPGEGGDLPPLIGSPALADAVPEGIGVVGAALVQLEPGASADEVQQAINESGRSVKRPAALDEFPATSSAGSTQRLRAATEGTTGVITTGLLILAGAAALLGALAVGQAAVRHHTATADEHLVQSAIGVTTAQGVAARLVAALPALALATVLVVAVGAGTAALAPPGALRLVEPHPGWSLNLTLLAVTTSLVVLVTAGLLALATVWTGRSKRHRPAREAPIVARVAALGSRPPTVLGLRFALERPGGGSAASPRAASLAMVATVAGVLACLTYSVSLHRVVTTPVRFGWPTDMVLVDGSPELGRELAADDRFDTVVLGESADIRIDGQASTALVQEQIKGDVDWELAAGRPPATSEEIVLGTREASELDKGVGDVVQLTDRDGDDHAVAVVGVGVLPAYNGDSLGRGTALTAEGLGDLAAAEPFGELGLSTAPGVDPAGVAADLADDYEMTLAEPPRDVRNLAEIDRVPLLLAAFLALLGAATLGHSIALTIRRRRPDLAAVRALGFTPRQTTTTILVMAAVVAVVGAAVGIPVGLALGSSVWRRVAEGAALIGDARVPWAVAGLAVPLSLLAALSLALLAGRPTRLRPARAPDRNE